MNDMTVENLHVYGSGMKIFVRSPDELPPENANRIYHLYAQAYQQKRGGRAWGTVIQHCFEAAKNRIRQIPDFKDFKFFAFIAQGGWQPDSRIVQHYRLWKREQWIQGILPNVACQPDFLFVSEHGVRYAGIVEVNDLIAPLLVKSLYEFSSSSFLFLKNPNVGSDAPGVQSTFEIAFPEHATELCWPNLAKELCSEGHMLFHLSGAFDDLEGVVDMIYPENFLPLITTYDHF